ncbi:vWA domain-containing protein [Roseimaritima sediminicola]|uniref:vWA domain-containing protein n=1 Tax=Roseimaritima sediminicola TaxID=2662066 RepID=UPI001386B8BE|nr:VWA domain-containing protein [Roseimaritima sediminicola]
MLLFHSPERWIWMLAAVPILLFFLLRTRLRRQPAATLMFWDEVFPQREARSFGRRLRHPLSLLLQLLFLTLLVLALLDPLWSSQKRTGRQLVLVLDRSASMLATSDGRSRWELAIEAAGEHLRSLRAGEEVALVTASAHPELVVNLTEYGPAVAETLQSLQPTEAAADIAAAIETAFQVAPDPRRRDVVLISDGGWNQTSRESIQERPGVRIQRVGSSVANAAITRFQTRRSLTDPTGYATLVEVHYFADDEQPLTCRLVLQFNDQLLDVVPLQLQPGQPWRRTFTEASTEGGVLTASLEADDGLRLDNHAAAVLPARQSVEINLVRPGATTDQPASQPARETGQAETNGQAKTAEPSPSADASPSADTSPRFLEQALRALPHVRLAVTPKAIHPAPVGGVAVLDRVVPESLPDGPLLFINPLADSPFWTLGPPLGDAVVEQPRSASPLLAHVRLQNVAVRGALPLRMNQPSTTLLRTADGQVLMASFVDTTAARARRVVVLSVPLDQTDLPLRVAFPILIANAIHHLTDHDQHLQTALQTGRIATLSAEFLNGAEPSAASLPGGSAGSDPGHDGESVTEENTSDAAADDTPPRVQTWTLVGPLADVGSERRTVSQPEDSAARSWPVRVDERGATIGPLSRTGVYAMRPPRRQRSAQQRLLAVNLTDRQESDLTMSPEGASPEPDQDRPPVRRPLWFYLVLLGVGLIVSEWVLYQRRMVG